MITLKQMEALHWIAELGTFERAAGKLNTTQSAISKRIQELELSSGLPIFDRNQRGARLTEQGEHLLALGRDMLAIQDRILELKHGKDVPARRLRLGVTELSALTWLPRLVTALRKAYPTVTIEPEVEVTRTLHDRLLEGTLDLIVTAEGLSDPDIAIVRLAEVANVWMARPGLVKGRRSLSLRELTEYTILKQGSRSGSGLFLDKWLKAQGVSFPRVLASDSVTALVGMAVAGLGVSYLPRECFNSLTEEGKLVVIPTKPALPLVPYAAIYRSDRPSAFISNVVNLASNVCDFSSQLQS